QILGAFAEFERERIRERVKDNMKNLATKEEKVITRPCVGYDIIDNKYVINQEQAKFIHMMVEWAIGGEGALKIAKSLNALGAKTKDGNSFSEGAVRK